MNSLKTRRRSKRIGDIVWFILMFLGALTMVLPFLWMLSTSLKSSNLVFSYPPQWIPDPVTWRNYVDVWSVAPLLRGFLNSTIVTVCVVTGSTIASTMAAFAFAKLDFKHKETAFLGLLSTMMIPGVVLMIPQFIMYTEVGWIDTLLPLIIPGMLGNITMIFFLRGFMMGLPTEVLDAAKIDGAGYFRAYWTIFLPMCKPAIAANVIIVFMGTWNDYMGPLIYTNSPERSTIQLVVASLSSYYAEQTNFPMIMAASIIAVIPVVVLFTALQKYFVESFAITGLK